MPTDPNPEPDPERAAFEAWITAPPIEAQVGRRGPDDPSWPGQYFSYAVQLAWEAWQAAGRWIPDEPTRLCQNTLCASPVFVPTHHKQLYCSPSCAAAGLRAYHRRRWHEHQQARRQAAEPRHGEPGAPSRGDDEGSA